MNVFVGYTNAALMCFATILKVHTIAHANMDSREMDENVKVGVGFISNHAMKKLKLTFANYPQRNDNFYLDPHSKFYSRSPKCFCTKWNESLFSDFIHPLLDRLFKAT